MLIRIVRMTFEAEKTGDFLAVFSASKAIIRAMPGCQHVELLRDLDQPNVFVTHSHWDNAADLNAYRNSAFFKETWAKTKALFADKPLAFSVERVG
jgi:quinol monooxygenase YgiN